MLFANFERSDTNPRRFSEPMFRHMNNSARPAIAKVREVFEGWYRSFPDGAKSNLLGRFRSEERRQHLGAAFELYCHAFLSGQGFVALSCPQSDQSQPKKAPDFLVKDSLGRQFYLEATLVAESDLKAKSESVWNQIHDELNKLDSPNFFVFATVNRMPNIPFRTTRLRRFLEAELNKLDPTRVAVMSGGKLDQLPEWEWDEGGASFTFRAIPKKAEARGRPSVRPIGAVTQAAEWIDSKTPILKTLRTKATKYGDLAAPYVIALNCLDIFVDEDDKADALFGTKHFDIDLADDDVRVSHAPDGLWWGPNGPHNTRVSAVLFGHNVLPWNMIRATPVLWHNPYAAHPLPINFWTGPQVVPNREPGRMQSIPGKNSAAILGLTPDWPGAMHDE